MKECCRFRTGKCVSAVNPQPMENFAVDRRRPDGRTPSCKSCLKEYRDQNKAQRRETIKAWRAAHPDKMREYRRKDAQRSRARIKRWREKTFYGLTPEMKQSMLQRQGNRCAICLRHEKELKRGLAIDHCHETGRVRGLLCHPCNQALGMLREDFNRFERAMDYLLGLHD